MKRQAVIIFGILIIFLMSVSWVLISWGYLRPFFYEGTYRGRIVDAATREPLKGVVVLGVWNTETPSVGGGVQHYYDAREAVTDKNGDFSIPGHGVRILSNLLPMRPIIFKAGYAYVECFWVNEWLNDERTCGVKVTWDGKIPVIPLRKLSPEQRYSQRYDPRYSHPGPPSDAPYEKVKFLLKEINKDRIERGLKPYTEWGGVKL
jgi:hypothetical protein